MKKKKMFALTLIISFVMIFFYEITFKCNFKTTFPRTSNLTDEMQNGRHASIQNSTVDFMSVDHNTTKNSLKEDRIMLQKFQVTSTTQPSISHLERTTFSLTNSSHNTTRPVILDDIFISVKTSRKYHANRLSVIVQTWFLLAENQTWFFTDGNDPLHQKKTNGHLINTKCRASHSRSDLTCKQVAELIAFLDKNKRWFCHFDDDNYVNVPELVKLLQHYNYTEDWYIGRRSIASWIPERNFFDPKLNKSVIVQFNFSTNGAGFCISLSLAHKMETMLRNGEFQRLGRDLKLNDDMLMGFVCVYLLKTELTEVLQLHSHYEAMTHLKKDTLKTQISLSYSDWIKDKQSYKNRVKLEGFTLQDDPTGFLALHCHLFPDASFCHHTT